MSIFYVCMYVCLSMLYVCLCVAAVSALAKFGSQCEELLPSVLVLLERYVSHIFTVLFLIADHPAGLARLSVCSVRFSRSNTKKTGRQRN